MQINRKNSDRALALGWENEPHCSAVLPLPCPLASDVRRKALPRDEKRDWERGGVFLKLVTLSNISSHLLGKLALMTGGCCESVSCRLAFATVRGRSIRLWVCGNCQAKAWPTRGTWVSGLV